MDPNDIDKTWDRFDEMFYANAKREELIENLRQIAGYNRYLIRISREILAHYLEKGAGDG